MRSLSPTRKLSFSKHTSYPTANLDKKFTPSETENVIKVNRRNADHELDAKKNLMNTMRRKSMNQLDSQRKQLEKSMMAYTEKMKEITNSRTNELFREIHSSDSDNSDSNCTCQCRRSSGSSTSSGSIKSFASSRSVPVHLEKVVNNRRHSELRSLKGFSQVDVRSPILEVRENTTPDLRRSRQSHSARSINSFRSLGNINICHTERSGLLKTKLIHAKLLAKRASEKELGNTENTVTTTVKIVTPENEREGSPSSTGRRFSSENKVAPKIAQKTSLPWMADIDNLSDSAYSSGTDDLESVSSAKSRGSVSSSVNDNEDTVNSADRHLLMVPKIHIRKGKVLKKKKKNNQTNALFKQSVLNRAQRKPNDSGVTHRNC